MIKISIRLIPMILCLVLAIPPLDAQIKFQNNATTLGINFTYGDNAFGGGVSFHDFDGDGWDDLSLSTQNQDSLAFFRNVNGTTFQQITPTLVPHTGTAEQLLWTDFDNDGDQDLFVTAFKTGNKLYRNDGGLNFTDITAAAGIPTDSMPSYAACIGDYDRDGFVDIYLTNRTEPGSLYYNYLLRNLGNGSFEDVTLATGTADPGKAPLAVMFVDINGDMYPDLYIAQDKFHGNTLLKNNGNGTFSDISVSSGANAIVDGMGITAGDYDNDGDLDLYFSNSPMGGNILLRNEGNETFTDVTSTLGLAHNGTCWGVSFLDYDNDADLDVYSSAVYYPFINNPASHLYTQAGNGTFSIATNAGFAGDSALSYSNAIGDWNRDGYPELAVHNVIPHGLHFWQNNANSTNTWIKIHLRGVQSNRDAVGTLIEIHANGIHQIRYTHCGTSYLAQNSGWEMVGLDRSSKVDSLIVHWPSGIMDAYYNVGANQHLELIEGETNIPFIGIPDGQPHAFFDIVPNPAQDRIQFNIEVKRATSCMLEIRDIRGRILSTQQLMLQPGNATHYQETQHLSSGVYLVQLRHQDGSQFTQKLLIQQD